MSETNPPPVAPVEGHYAMLRNGIIEKIGERKATLDGHIMFHAVNFNFRWFDSGKSYWDNGQYDIIATISPADMQAVASGELERLRAERANLIAACDSVLDWADANARWFDISTAPRDGKGVLTYPHYRVTSWSDELGGFSFWSDYDDNEVLYNPQPTHWTPLPPPPSNPPLPAPLEALGAVLRRVKGCE